MFGRGELRCGGRGEVRLDLLRFVAVCSGGLGWVRRCVSGCVGSRLVKAVGVTLGEV